MRVTRASAYIQGNESAEKLDHPNLLKVTELDSGRDELVLGHKFYKQEIDFPTIHSFVYMKKCSQMCPNRTSPNLVFLGTC